MANLLHWKIQKTAFAQIKKAFSFCLWSPFTQMFLQHFATLPLLCCCHICRLITPAPPMKSGPRSSRKWASVKPLSRIILWTPGFPSTFSCRSHSQNSSNLTSSTRRGGICCVFATRGYILRTVLHFSSQPQITPCSAGRGPTIWSPMLRIKSWSGLYIEVYHSAMQTRWQCNFV